MIVSCLLGPSITVGVTVGTTVGVIIGLLQSSGMTVKSHGRAVIDCWLYVPHEINSKLSIAISLTFAPIR